MMPRRPVRPRPRRASLAAVLLVVLGASLVGAAPATAQAPRPTPDPAYPVPSARPEEVLPAGPPRSLSARLRAQGHPVAPAEAAYLDADEQVTEQYVRLLVVVQELAALPPTTPEWRRAMVLYLEAMANLDPAAAPVPPPDGLLAVHTHAVAYREGLGTAARQWLAAIRAEDPAWLLQGADAYGAAEQARLAWQKALWEYYVGEPAPGP